MRFGGRLLIVKKLFGCAVHNGKSSLWFDCCGNAYHFPLVQVQILKLHPKEIRVVHHIILFWSSF